MQRPKAVEGALEVVGSSKLTGFRFVMMHPSTGGVGTSSVEQDWPQEDLEPRGRRLIDMDAQWSESWGED
jgi:hypothetical protein